MMEWNKPAETSKKTKNQQQQKKIEKEKKTNTDGADDDGDDENGGEEGQGLFVASGPVVISEEGDKSSDKKKKKGNKVEGLEEPVVLFESTSVAVPIEELLRQQGETITMWIVEHLLFLFKTELSYTLL